MHIKFLFAFLLLHAFCFSQLEKVDIHYKLQNIQAIDFSFQSFPKNTHSVKISTVNVGWRDFKYNTVNTQTTSVIFNQLDSVLTLRSGLYHTTGLNYLYDIQFLNENDSLISESYYHVNPDQKHLLKLAIGRADLTNRHETHSFIATWNTEKDVCWRISWDDREFNTNCTHDYATLQPVTFYSISSDDYIYKEKLSFLITDKDVIGGDMVMRSDSVLSVYVDYPIDFYLKDKALIDSVKVHANIDDIQEVEVKEDYSHSEIKAFKYISQKDTMVNSTIMRKVDFEIESNFLYAEARLKTNVPLNGWFIQDGTDQHLITLDSTINKFSMIYPTRQYSEAVDSLKVELTNHDFIPYIAPISIPFMAIDSSKFEFIQVEQKKLNDQYRVILLQGDHSANIEEGIYDFQHGLVLDNDYDSHHSYSFKKKKYQWQFNHHASDKLTFLIYEKNWEDEKFITSMVTSLHSSELPKKGFKITLPNGDKIPFKVKRHNYIAPLKAIDLDKTRTVMKNGFKFPQAESYYFTDFIRSSNDLELNYPTSKKYER